MEDNADAWDLWLAVNTQWRVGMGGAVGLDYTAMNFVARTLDIEINQNMLYKIQTLERYTASLKPRKDGDDEHGSQ